MIVELPQTSEIGSAWAVAANSIRNYLKKAEYLGVVANMVEHAVIPASNHMELHKCFDPIPMFSLLQAVYEETFMTKIYSGSEYDARSCEHH